MFQAGYTLKTDELKYYFRFNHLLELSTYVI